MGRTACITLALVAALATPAAAGAQPRAATIAEQLRVDGLYVSDSMARVATSAAVGRVRAALERWHGRAFVVWAPTFSDEPSASLPSDLLAQVIDRTGRDGVYVYMDESGISDEVTARRVRTTGDAERAPIIASADVPLYEGAAARIAYTLDYLRTGERPTRGAGDRYLNRDERAGRTGWIAFGVATVATLVLLTLHRMRRRRRKVAGVGPPAGVRVDAEIALERLSHAIDRTDGPPERALDALGAGHSALERHSDLDAVGALVLARSGEAALRGKSGGPCFFNPLHPAAMTEVRYARGGAELGVPACEACAKAVRSGRRPEALLDRGRPYFERDTVWARTGFGATDPDLAAQLLAGRR